MTGAAETASVEALGYTPREAAFLRVVVAHGGHFQRRHFLAFAGASHRQAAEAFIARGKALRHITEAPYGRTSWRRYHVNSLAVYEALGVPTSSARKSDRSGETLASKLMGLDYVLAHRDVRFVEEETDKVEYFSKTLGVAVEKLPRRLFGRPGSPRPVTRFFVDKFPLYVRESEAGSVVGFTYVHVPGRTVRCFATHLTRYAPLLGSLAVPFEVVFVADADRFFPLAEKLFDDVVKATSVGSWDADLVRYFEVRRAYEEKAWSRLSTGDYDYRIKAAKKYSEPHHEVLYHEWLAGQVRGAAESASPSTSPAKMASSGSRGMFKTYLVSWAREAAAREESIRRFPLGRLMGRSVVNEAQAGNGRPVSEIQTGFEWDRTGGGSGPLSVNDGPSRESGDVISGRSSDE